MLDLLIVSCAETRNTPVNTCSPLTPTLHWFFLTSLSKSFDSTFDPGCARLEIPPRWCRCFPNLDKIDYLCPRCCPICVCTVDCCSPLRSIPFALFVPWLARRRHSPRPGLIVFRPCDHAFRRLLTQNHPSESSIKIPYHPSGALRSSLGISLGFQSGRYAGAVISNGWRGTLQGR